MKKIIDTMAPSLTTVFVILKLVGVFEYGWWVVLLPIILWFIYIVIETIVRVIIIKLKK